MVLVGSCVGIIVLSDSCAGNCDFEVSFEIYAESYGYWLGGDWWFLVWFFSCRCYDSILCFLLIL